MPRKVTPNRSESKRRRDKQLSDATGSIIPVSGIGFGINPHITMGAKASAWWLCVDWLDAHGHLGEADLLAYFTHPHKPNDFIEVRTDTLHYPILCAGLGIDPEPQLKPSPLVGDDPEQLVFKIKGALADELRTVELSAAAKLALVRATRREFAMGYLLEVTAVVPVAIELADALGHCTHPSAAAVRSGLIAALSA